MLLLLGRGQEADGNSCQSPSAVALPTALVSPPQSGIPRVHTDSGSQHRAEPLIYHMQGGSRDAKETISLSPQRVCILAKSRQYVSWEGHQNGQHHASSLDLELAIPFVNLALGFFVDISSVAIGGRCGAWILH